MNYAINKVLSNGYAVGKVKIIKTIKHKNDKKDAKAEIEKFKSAKEKALASLAELKLKEPALEEFIMVEELMIQDPSLNKGVISLIEDGKSASDAVKETMDKIITTLLNANTDYLKERVSDLEDITNTLINNINGVEHIKGDDKYILLVDDLLPSYIINHHDNIIGIIAKKGGFTSHSAILARIWDIPYVTSEVEAKENDTLIIDTRIDKIEVNPSEEEILKYKDTVIDADKFDKKAVKHPGCYFMANVATNRDIERAMEYDFDGIGLFRTEFIFMNSERPYTLAEHYLMYSSASKLVGDKPIVFRTFDVKDDKAISYLKIGKKTIDTYKKNKEIFENQIKGILASNVKGNVRIMFPMIETKEDFKFLKDWVIKIQKENNYKLPKIGMMLETKKALKNIEDFTDVDFISIGTNDLTKELYNVNRNEENKYSLYLDDLLLKLRKVVDFASRNDIFLSVCGELASIKEVALKYYEIGIRSLSVSPFAMRNLNSAFNDFKNKKRRLFIAGDSTLAHFNDLSYLYPRYGYGELLKEYFDDRLEVVNLALSGRSARSFLREANYKRLFDEIKPNDFLLIGFGHNDEKEDDTIRFSSAKLDINNKDSFMYVLNEYYIKRAKALNVTCVLATPIARLSKDNKYSGIVIHDTINGNYKDAIIEAGSITNTPVINLTDPTAKIYFDLGYKDAIYHHAITKASKKVDNKYIPEILAVDNTHLSYYGAKYVAYLFSEALRISKSDLKYFLKERIKKPTEKDIKVNPDYKFIKYKEPDLKKYNPSDNFKSTKEDYYGTYFGKVENSYNNELVAYDDGEKIIVGTKEDVGHIYATSTAIAFYFKKIPLSKNMRAYATIKVLSTGKIKQSGFGIMIRDDCYINQKDNNYVISNNEIGCGLLTTDNQTYVFHSKDSLTEIHKEKHILNDYYKVGDTIKCEIVRLGQKISLTLLYKNHEYKKDYYDFDLKAIDNKNYYVGIYATKMTLVESTDFNIEILNDAKEA